eukprot:2297940-Pyramimonas_sp.AAC.1
MGPPEAVRVALAAAAAVCDGSGPPVDPGVPSVEGAASGASEDDHFASFTACGHRMQTRGPFF